LIAGLDFVAGECPEAIHAKLLATEAAHHGPINDRAAQVGKVDLTVVRRNTLAGKVSDEAASKAIARAGGIEHVFQQVAGDHEVAVAAEEDGTVFSALDH